MTDIGKKESWEFFKGWISYSSISEIPKIMKLITKKEELQSSISPVELI